MLTSPSLHPQPVHRVHPQRGIVLVVALIMMAVIAVSSAIAIKLSMSGGMIASSLRGNNLAMQAAEAGLRWCELQARLAVRGQPSQVVIQGATLPGLELWRTLGNFSNNAIVTVAPQAVLATNGLINYPRMPECVVEQQSLRPPVAAEEPGLPSAKDQNEVLLITVRGFSPDYRRIGNNSTGGEVWLQSTLYIPI